MSDEQIIKEISSTTTIIQEDDDVITTTLQETAQDAINVFDLCLQWTKESGASYNELLLLSKLRDEALILRF